ncbi:MAG TPA: HEAT repeat domain-containing protein [bacterium]|nr:HEAT repeat domain-containing protein [bacterium]
MFYLIRHRIASILNIYDEDWKPLLTLQLFIVSICAVIANLKTISNALFVANIGAKSLPLTYIGCALTLIASGMVLIPVIDKMQRHRVYILTVSILSAFVFFSYAMITLQHRWIYFLLYVVAYIMDTVLFLEFWLIATDLCDARQSKRIFPLIIGWSLVGGMIGAFGTKMLVKHLATEQLLLISGGALVSTIAIIFLIKMIFPKEIALEDRGHRASNVGRFKRILLDVNIMKESSLLRYICASFILYSFLTYLLDFQFNVAASAHYTVGGQIQTQRLTAFYGMFDGISIAAALFFQFFLANRFLNMFGVANSQLILPSVFTAGFGAIMAGMFASRTVPATQPFYPTLLTRLGQKVTSSSIYRASYNLLYNPISKEKRGRSKTFSESLVQPLGVLAVGIAILFLKGLNPLIICGISIAISLLYILTIVKMKTAYIKSILSIFDAKNYSQLESFAGLFGKLGEKEILNKLYQVMDDRDFNIRCFIVDILGEINNKGTAEPLAALYEAEDNERVRATIVRVLGKLGGSRATAIVSSALSDQAPRIRANAVEAIVWLKNPDLVARLHGLLDDPHHRVKASAAVAVFSLRLVASTARAVAILSEMYDTGIVDNKLSALYAFGKIGSEQYFPYIMKGVDDRDFRIKQRAILALGQTGHPRAAVILIDILRSWHPSTVKNIATQALIGMGKTALGALVGALDDRDVYEHTYILKALTPIADKSLRPPLEKAAKEEIETIKHNQHYIERLETIPLTDAVIVLIDALKEQVAEAKENIMNILTIMSGNSRSVKLIMKNLHHPNRFSRANAIEALEQIGEKEIVKEFIPLLESEQTRRLPAHQPTGDEQTKAIKDLLKSEYRWVRAAAVFALGKLKALAYRDEIAALINDSYYVTRANAVETLLALYGSAERDLYLRAKADSSPLVREYAEAALKACSA